ncbi:MAG: NOP5/NOP56 family protein [Halobacteriaceae archaeon]
MNGQGWFAGLDQEETDTLVSRIRSSRGSIPKDWPSIAVEADFVDDTQAYYSLLHDLAIEAAQAEITDRESAEDQQLIHAVRTLDALESTRNELGEQAIEWAHTHFSLESEEIQTLDTLQERSVAGKFGQQLNEFIETVQTLRDNRDELQTFIQRETPAIAPNLSLLAGPVLAARLIALAGGLEDLAKMPSSTVQVLGAEDALFSHLQGEAPSPKHGIIYTHEYIRHTDISNRGSAARAMAGKLSIAARIDYYSGDIRPELADELDERIQQIRNGGDGNGSS